MAFFPLKFAKLNSRESVAQFFDLPDDMSLDLAELERFAVGDEFLRKSYNGPLSGINAYALSNKDRFMKFLKIDSFKQYRTEMRDMVMMGILGERWNRYKQVYRIDPDFLAELCDTDNVKIPLRVFTEQPYPCFYVDLSNTDVFAPFIGFFVNISIDPVLGLPNLSLLRVAKQEGVDEEVMYSAYFLAKDFIAYQMVEIEKGEVFIHVDRSQIATDTERTVNVVAAAQGALPFIEDVQTFTLFVFQLLQFLGSEKPDIVVRQEISNQKKEKKEKKEAASKRVQEAEVGFRYGAAIRSYRKRYITSNDERPVSKNQSGNDTRKHRAAHIRRAHWQVYWTGKGRKIPVTRWVAPFMAGGKKNHVDVTIHNVKP